MATKLYTHPGCLPCKDVKERVAKNGGKIDGEPVIIVDITTEKGFAEFNREVLSQSDGAAAVPTAYKDGHRCKILRDNNAKKLHLDCSKDQPAKSA
jgi:hypothetical protein